VYPTVFDVEDHLVLGGDKSAGLAAVFVAQGVGLANEHGRQVPDPWFGDVGQCGWYSFGEAHLGAAVAGGA
jgi:hypothetical protein